MSQHVHSFWPVARMFCHRLITVLVGAAGLPHGQPETLRSKSATCETILPIGNLITILRVRDFASTFWRVWMFWCFLFELTWNSTAKCSRSHFPVDHAVDFRRPIRRQQRHWPAGSGGHCPGGWSRSNVGECCPGQCGGSQRGDPQRITRRNVVEPKTGSGMDKHTGCVWDDTQTQSLSHAHLYM